MAVRRYVIENRIPTMRTMHTRSTRTKCRSAGHCVLTSDDLFDQ